MKSARQLFSHRIIAFFVVLIPVSTPAIAQPLTLKHAVELALAHSPAAGQIAADEQRAFASMREARDQYIPQLQVGSGIGDTWGYPLTLEGVAPSLVNINAQSALFNPALREFMRAANSEFKATQLSDKDRRAQIVQETVLSYLELLKWQQLTVPLQQQHNEAIRMEGIVKQRIDQGIDNPQLLAQARLATARANLHLAQAEDGIHELRAALSQLTGIPADSIEMVADSVPALPDPPLQSDLPQTVADSHPNVLFAREHAIAEAYRAKGEHRTLWPTADFATQYAVLAKFNNWLQFFPNNVFQRNNATVGVVLRFPFFSPAQKAHAAGADAEAARASKEAESTRNQVSQQVLKLQDSVRQLIAAKEVSDLEYEIAKSNSDAVEVRVNSGTATIHDQANARVEMFEKYNASQDADFALTQARIQLLRATGDLESWVEHNP